jgi:uncharacterized protein YnzC (UPF0291/DUF896 family)
MSCFCRTTPKAPSYFVVCIDYGRKGREAVVDPEMTRRGVIERIRSKEYDRISFIHFVDEGHCQDVTNELLKEAGFYEEAHNLVFG